MYPVLFKIGDFEITSFGVMVAIGALVGLWILHRELLRSRLPSDALDAAIAGVVGGLGGAKLLWVVEHLGEESIVGLLFSRGGLSWFGGFAGGILAGLVVMHWKRLPKIAVLAAATPALAFGHLIGRIGCFLVGDDYGRPSHLPWAVAFPQGLPPTTVPVHPTQLYEAAGLAVLGWMLLRWRRQDVDDKVVLGRYLVAAGTLRFGIEFLRVNTRVLWGLTVAHVVSLAVITIGLGMLAFPRDEGRIPLQPNRLLMRRFYLTTRDLHLFIGLFLSPFVLLFAVSVFYLVHGLANRPAPGASDPSRTVGVVVSPDIARLEGRARVDALRPLLEQLNVRGEIDFVRHIANERRLIVPVGLPDRDTIVAVDYGQQTATVTTRDLGIGDAVVYLHKMPGPHNEDVRGNSALIRLWRIGADATVYLLLFITVSGIYLWAVLRAERRVGLVFLLAGAITFWGLVYAVAA